MILDQGKPFNTAQQFQRGSEESSGYRGRSKGPLGHLCRRPRPRTCAIVLCSPASCRAGNSPLRSPPGACRKTAVGFLHAADAVSKRPRLLQLREVGLPGRGEYHFGSKGNGFTDLPPLGVSGLRLVPRPLTRPVGLKEGCERNLGGKLGSTAAL